MPKPVKKGGVAAGKPEKKRPTKWKSKDLTYSSYNASHPALLDEVNGIVANGLSQISKKREQQQGKGIAGPQPESVSVSDESSELPDAKRLEVYRMAFQCYMASSNIYKPFLVAFLQEYDNSLRGMENKLRESSTFRAEISALQDQYEKKLHSLESKHANELNEYSATIKSVETKLVAAERNLGEAEERATKAVNAAAKMEKEWDEMRISCSTITNSLVRYEESNKSLKRQEAQHQAAYVRLKVAEEKGNNEAEKLRARVQELEEEQALMVSHEEIEEKIEEIEHLRLLLKTSEKENNQLIQRYTVLKAAISTSFKKQAVRTGASDQALSDFSDKLHSVNDIPPADDGSSPVAHATAPTAATADNSEDIPAAVNNKNGGSSNTSSRAMKGGQFVPTVDSLLENPEMVLGFMDAMGADFRSLIEALLDYISELKSMVTFKVSLHTVSEAVQGKSVGAILEAQEKSAKQKKMTEDGMVATVGDRVQAEWAHFEGLGEDQIVPPFLRVTGKVPNLFFTRKDVGSFIKQVMNDARTRAKPVVAGPPSISAESDVNSAPSFPKHFYSYMIERFRHQSKVVEVSYNLIEGSRKYRQESDCRLFLAILDGLLPEEVWYDMIDSSQSLLTTMLAKESKSVNVIDGKRRLTVDEFMRAIRQEYPQRNSNALSRVVRALQLENKSARFVMNLKGMLAENADGSRSMLCELLRSQHITEIIEFQEFIVECVNSVRKSPKEETTIIGRLRIALEKADPAKSRSEINALLVRGAGVSQEEMLLMEVKRVPIKFDPFLVRLKSGLLKKTHPKE
jgi:hypothetical protein